MVFDFALSKQFPGVNCCPTVNNVSQSLQKLQTLAQIGLWLFCLSKTHLFLI